MSKRLLIVAGEASGDLHGARLLSDLRERIPGVEAYGLGGDRLEALGVDFVADVSSISVIGLAEVARVVPEARKIFARLVERAKADPPDAAILIDFPEFNLRLAPVLKRLGIKVIYYVSPQVWAWRKGRIRSMARSIDLMLVFFPFEVDFYRGRLAVRHVGHPIVDEVPQLAQAWDSESAPDPLRLVLLPGSRMSEVRRLLPMLLESARELREVYPDMETAIVLAASVEGQEAREMIAPHEASVRVVPEADRFEAIAAAHLALCASGTATLEVGLLRTPMIVVYRIGLFSYWLGRLIVDVPFISLVNLVMGRAVVPELVQGAARAERIAAEARGILEDPARRQRMRSDLRGLRSALGEPGATSRAAGEVATFLAGGAG